LVRDRERRKVGKTKMLHRLPEMSHFIGGEFRKDLDAEVISVRSPTTGQELGRVADGTPSMVDAAVSAATLAQRKWWGLAPVERERLLRKVADLLQDNVEQLAQLEAADTGKPYRKALGEAQGAPELFHFAAGYPTKQMGSHVPLANPYQLCYTIREPVGVVAAITPWNYPLALAATKLSAALAAGCSVVMKPSPETPLTTLELARLVQEAGLPVGVFNVVTGGGGTGAALLGHRGIAKASFTGSAATGKAVLHSLADNLRPTVLELGGKNPNVVFPDVDLQANMRRILMAALNNSGQECVAGAKILVHESIYERFLEVADDELRGLRISTAPEETDLGPLISEDHRERVRGFVDRALSEGARIQTTTEVPDSGYYYPPTMLVDIREEMEVWQEEVFGPVIAVDTFSSDQEALQKANSTPYGLAAGIWTNDIGRSVRFARDMQAGMVFVNSYLAGSANAPFGGIKDSGFGFDSGLEGILEFTRPKAVYVQGALVSESANGSEET
jgi:acyl-CoA reductase-like NAD-dependent aldehyde dehydrogenase